MEIAVIVALIALPYAYILVWVMSLAHFHVKENYNRRLMSESLSKKES